MISEIIAYMIGRGTSSDRCRCCKEEQKPRRLKLTHDDVVDNRMMGTLFIICLVIITIVTIIT